MLVLVLLEVNTEEVEEVSGLKVETRWSGEVFSCWLNLSIGGQEAKRLERERGFQDFQRLLSSSADDYHRLLAVLLETVHSSLDGRLCVRRIANNCCGIKSGKIRIK